MSLEYQAFQFSKSKHPSDLVSDIRDLWEALTVERSEGLAQYFRKPALRRAYLGYYLPMYAMKIAALLRDLHLPIREPNVLDLGAGPLSAIWGAQIAYGTLGQVLAVDQDIGPMKLGLELLDAIAPLKNINFVRANLKGPPHFWKARFKPDLILMAHVLNEFGVGERYLEDKKMLLVHAVNQLAPQGVIVVVEPASKSATRDLMQLRDWLYASGQVDILAPCPPQVEHCPLLVDKNNWCHADLPYERPKELQEIDRQIGFQRDVLKCSYLAIARRGFNYQPTHCRIVSGHMNARGIDRRYACMTEGLMTLSQNAHEKPAILASLRRGEAVDLDLWPKKLVKMSKES
jgi:ribosomal protein RSM22 (predicted rRNA methylase)